MKIGIFVSVVAGQKGFERNVSGHIQVPLRSIDELRKAGHDVHLITNEFGKDRSLPFCLPDDLAIHFVTDARKRGGVLERTGKQKEGLSTRLLFRQVLDIKRICKEEHFDVLHMFGYNRTAHLAGGLRLLGLQTPVVVTMFGTHFPERLAFITRQLWKRVDAIVTATKFVKGNLEAEGLPTTQVPHGVIRDLVDEHEGSALIPKDCRDLVDEHEGSAMIPKDCRDLVDEHEGSALIPKDCRDLVDEHDGSALHTKHRVLFWRDMTVKNGADVAIAVYEKLAPKFPTIDFDFAVRPHWEPIEGIDKIAATYPNIHIFRFPYEEGITLPKLLLESICVVMPIRRMSIDPQLVIAETLAAGIPIITTDQRSNPEFVVEGKTGYLVPLGDVEATTSALDHMLSDLEATAEMGRKGKEDIATRWNWDQYAADLLRVYERIIR